MLPSHTCGLNYLYSFLPPLPIPNPNHFFYLHHILSYLPQQLVFTSSLAYPYPYFFYCYFTYLLVYITLVSSLNKYKPSQSILTFSRLYPLYLNFLLYKYLFLILSNLVIPHIHLGILISATFIFKSFFL